MKFYAYLILAIVVVLMLAELIPEAINAFLALLLLGVILGRHTAFRQLIAGVTGKTRK